MSSLTPITRTACTLYGTIGAGAAPPSSGVAPAITGQPSGASVTTPNVAVFTVTATGTATLHYNWYLAGAATGPDANVYTTPTITDAKSYLYDGQDVQVKVSNGYGEVWSSAAMITVTSGAAPSVPSFTSQPANLTFGFGAPAKFVSVAVSGTPTPTTQWYEYPSNLLLPVTSGREQFLTVEPLVLTFDTTKVGTPPDTTNWVRSYYSVATSSAGTATSSVAVVTINSTTTDGGVAAGLPTIEIAIVPQTPTVDAQGAGLTKVYTNKAWVATTPLDGEIWADYGSTSEELLDVIDASQTSGTIGLQVWDTDVVRTHTASGWAVTTFTGAPTMNIDTLSFLASTGLTPSGSPISSKVVISVTGTGVTTGVATYTASSAPPSRISFVLAAGALVLPSNLALTVAWTARGSNTLDIPPTPYTNYITLSAIHIVGAT